MIQHETSGEPVIRARSWTPTEALSFAWQRVKDDPFVIVGGLILAILVSGAVGAIFSGLAGRGSGALAWFASTLGGIGNWLVAAYMTGGITRFCLKVGRGERYGFEDLWSGGRTFLRVLVTQALLVIAVGFGLVLLIVPGILLALGLSMAIPLVVDRGLDPLSALEESWRLTEGHKWRLFVYAVLLTLLSIVGLLACGVGVLFVAALAYLGQAYIYLRLTGQPTVDVRRTRGYTAGGPR